MQVPPLSGRGGALWLAIIALRASSLAQSTATDPLGCVVLTIPGTGGVEANAISFQGLGLVQPVLFQGAAEAVNSAAQSLTDNDAVWTDDQFNGRNGAHFIEIVRPAGQSTAAPGEGTTYDIASTSAATKTITTVQPLASGLGAGTAFKIRKHWTIGSVFGAANSAGFQGSDDPSTADLLQIWNGYGFDVYYYQIAAPQFGGTGWRSPNDVFADASATIIYPDDGLVFKLKQNGPISVVLTGAAKTGQTSFPIASGFNIVANVYIAPMTLASCGIQTSGLVGSDDPAAADQVMLWNGAGYDVYYYRVAPSQNGGTGWRALNDTSTEVGGTQIPVGSSLIIKRNIGTAFNWVIPQHPTSF